MNYVKGDLIKLALEGNFDVITHGCNCFCKMGSGIAVPMKQNFGCDVFPLEENEHLAEYNKLGQIDCRPFEIKNGKAVLKETMTTEPLHVMWVVNSYTQYYPGRAIPPYDIPLDYDALQLCFRKINRKFSGQHLGIPMIGSGLAGGNWNRISIIIKKETTDMEVTVVEYDK